MFELYLLWLYVLWPSVLWQVAEAYDLMLATPLERRGHCVHLVLAIDRGCPALDATLVAMHGGRAALANHEPNPFL